jgi:hypothetical protein
MVKQWELNQEFGLEGMPQVAFGAKANPRAWIGDAPFYTAPNMLHIPAGTGIGNGSVGTLNYLSLAWYQMQLLLNDGQGTQTDHTPIDFGYVNGMVENVYVDDAVLPGSMLQLEWSVKALQEYTLSGNGPQTELGWSPTQTSPTNFVLSGWLPLWSATSPAEEATLMQAYTQAWFNQASQYTPQQYYTGGWTTATNNPATDEYATTFGGEVWYMLPRLRYLGVSATLTDQIAAWAATIWPVGNWTLNKSATCSSIDVCTSGGLTN